MLQPLHLSALSLAVLSSLAPAQDAAQPITEDELLGCWSGSVEHDGTSSDFAARFERHDSRVLCQVSMPPIDAWDIPFGYANVTALGVSIGDWRLTAVGDAEHRSLVGHLPKAMVPVHEIPVTLRRGELAQPAVSQVDWGPQAKPIWTHATGSPVWAGLTADHGTVYVGAEDGRIRALDHRTGALRWKVPTGGPIRARPTRSGAYLLVHSDDGHVYKIAVADGTVIWRTAVVADTAGSARDASRFEHYSAAVAVRGDRAYVGTSDGQLVALDLVAGSKVWSFSASDAITSQPTVDDDHVYFGSFDGHVRALALSDGALAWQVDTGAAVVSSPTISGEHILVGSRSYDFFALRRSDGSIAWQDYSWFSWIESAAQTHGNIANVGSSDAQRVRALAVDTGIRLWEFDVGGSIWSQPAATADHVFAGAVGVREYMVAHRGAFVALHRTSGEAAWHFRTSPPDDPHTPIWGFAAAPTASGERVYCADLSGQVYAFAQQPD